MKRALGVLLAVFGLVGCDEGPTFDEYLARVRDFAGPGARGCGVVSLGESREDALSCGKAALAHKEAFWVVCGVQGIDSQLFYGVAVADNGRARHFTLDIVTRRLGRVSALREASCTSVELIDSEDEELRLCTLS